MKFDFKQASADLGCEVASEEQADKIIADYMKALKSVTKLGLQLSDDEVAPYQSAPYLESIVNQWNKAFSKCHLNYGLQIREFDNVTTFVFSDYTNNIMLSGNSLLDVFKPAVLLKVMTDLIDGFNKVQKVNSDLKGRKGYGVMKRKDFAGNALDHPDYLGEHVYRGKVSGNYLTDKKGKRHAINSRYVTGFKFFQSIDEMKSFNF